MLKLLAMLVWPLLEDALRGRAHDERCACQELLEENEMLRQRVKTLDELDGFMRSIREKDLKRAVRYERN